MRKKQLPPSLDEIDQSVREQSKALFQVPDKPILIYARSTGKELRPIEQHVLQTIEKHPGLLRIEIQSTMSLKIRLNNILATLQNRGLVKKKPVTVFIKGRRARSYGYYLSGTKPSST